MNVVTPIDYQGDFERRIGSRGWRFLRLAPLTEQIRSKLTLHNVNLLQRPFGFPELNQRSASITREGLAVSAKSLDSHVHLHLDCLIPCLESKYSELLRKPDYFQAHCQRDLQEWWHFHLSLLVGWRYLYVKLYLDAAHMCLYCLHHPNLGEGLAAASWLHPYSVT